MVTISWDPINGVSKYIIEINGMKFYTTETSFKVSPDTKKAKLYAAIGDCVSNPVDIEIREPPSVTFSREKAKNTFQLAKAGKYKLEGYNLSGTKIFEKIFTGDKIMTGLKQEIPYLSFYYTFTEVDDKGNNIGPSTPRKVTGNDTMGGDIQYKIEEYDEPGTCSAIIVLPSREKYVIQNITRGTTLTETREAFSIGNSPPCQIQGASDIIIYLLDAEGNIRKWSRLKV